MVYDDLVNIFGDKNRNEKGAGFSFSIDRIRELLDKNLFTQINQNKVLIAYHKNIKYEDALAEQIRLHRKGIIAMVELESCDSKEAANELKLKRGFDKLLWLS